jgi:hypothetical protein
MTFRDIGLLRIDTDCMDIDTKTQRHKDTETQTDVSDMA